MPCAPLLMWYNTQQEEAMSDVLVILACIYVFFMVQTTIHVLVSETYQRYWTWKEKALLVLFWPQIFRKIN